MCKSAGTKKAEILLIASHHPLGHLYIGKEHPELELKASLRKRMCVHVTLTGELVTGVSVCVCVVSSLSFLHPEYHKPHSTNKVGTF